MNQKRLHQMTITGLMIALTCITTMFFQIPVPETRGYVHFGDSFILLAGCLFGPVPGMLTGAIGSAMADLLSGYGHWAPFTLVIKGVEGLLAGYLLAKCNRTLPRVLVLCLAALVMAAGYLAAECVLYTPPVALLSLPGNLLQWAFSVVLAAMLEKPLKKFVNQQRF